MSKRDHKLIKRRIDIDDDPYAIVERHPRGHFPYKIIIFLFILFFAVQFLYTKKADLQNGLNEIQNAEIIRQLKKSTKEIKSASVSIHELVKQNSVNKIKQQISSFDKASLNKVVNGMTPIMLAASQGNVEIIDLLFTQGADPNKRGSMQRTALQYATEKNHIEVAKRLLAYGADIDAYDNGRLTPLVMAASRGYTDLALFYIQKGADVNIQHVDGWTALIDATAHGDIKLVQALLNAGADKELKANNGLKAIDYADQYGFKEITKMLRK